MMRFLQTLVEALSFLGLKTLRLLCLTTLLVPGLIVVASIVVGSMNTGDFGHEDRLPGVFVYIYMLAGLASPLVGAVALITLYAGKRRHVGDYGADETKLRRHIYILSVLDLLSVIAWVPGFLVVFFDGIGASR